MGGRSEEAGGVEAWGGTRSLSSSCEYLVQCCTIMSTVLHSYEYCTVLLSYEYNDEYHTRTVSKCLRGNTREKPPGQAGDSKIEGSNARLNISMYLPTNCQNHE